MKNLIKLLKEIEIEYRAFKEIKSKTIWEKLSKLTDWEYRIVQDFILRVNLFIKENNLNFVYKIFEKESNSYQFNSERKFDLLIVTTRRNQNDLVLTDIRNRLVVPENITYNTLDIWGLDIIQARNMAVRKACDCGCKYLLFVDDDIIAPNNALLNLFELINKTNKLVVCGNYYRKVEPLITAHGNFNDTEISDNIKETDLCGMGFTLMNIDEISKKVPFPLFWAFGSEDGYWSMGEDYFFSKNLFEYTKEQALVDINIKLLHFDKTWKKCYGVKDNNAVYASNAINNLKTFEQLRIPNDFPLILIATPLRKEDDPIAFDLTRLKMRRSFQSDFIKVVGHRVDEARNLLAEECLRRDAKYLLFIDNDIIPPDHDFCTLIDILEEDNSIGMVSGNYQLKGLPSDSVHLQLDKKGMVVELDKIKTEEKLIENNWLVGMGFCLIRVDCFKQIRKPWFMCHSKNNLDNFVNEDAHFTELILQNGYKAIVDQSIQCLHVDFQTKKIYGQYNKDFVYADNKILNNPIFEVIQ